MADAELASRCREAREFIANAVTPFGVPPVDVTLEADDLVFRMEATQALTWAEQDHVDARLSGLLDLLPDGIAASQVFVFFMHRGSVSHSWTRNL
jgi:hypothetical protein